MLQFPYFKDVNDEPFIGGIQPGKGLTAYVLRTGKSLLCTQAVHDELERRGEVKLLGAPSAIWLGVPLIVEGKTIGAMVVQHYADPQAYGEREQHMLEFVSTQIALAIHRKQTEQARHEGERRFREMLENAALIALMLDSRGRVTFCNDYLLRLIGRLRADVVGQDWFETFVPKESAIQNIFSQGMQQGTIVPHFENEIVTASGARRTVSWNNTVLRDMDGRIIGTASLGEDITERKQGEEAVRRRAEELSALQSTVLEITAPHDLNTLLQTITERAAQLIGGRSGGLYLCDPDRKEVRCVVSYNTPRDFAGTILKYGEGAAGTVAQTGEPLVIEDYRVWSQRAGAYEEEQPFTAVLSAPMIWQNQVTGVIDVLDDVESRSFTATDLALLTLFAHHAAIAVANTRLYEEAQKEILERKQAEEVDSSPRR